MSKQQEQILRVASAIVTGVLTFGIVYGAMKTQMDCTVEQVHENTDNIVTLKEHMAEQRTDIKWIRSALESD